MSHTVPAYDEYLSTGIDPTGGLIVPDNTETAEEPENPYAAVREEQWSDDDNGIHTVYTKAYDAQGRVVGRSTTHYRDGKEIGQYAKYVEADGYWHGGVYDAETGMGCQIYQPFIEGEEE